MLTGTWESLIAGWVSSGPRVDLLKVLWSALWVCMSFYTNALTLCHPDSALMACSEDDCDLCVPCQAWPGCPVVAAGK